MAFVQKQHIISAQPQSQQSTVSFPKANQPRISLIKFCKHAQFPIKNTTHISSSPQCQAHIVYLSQRHPKQPSLLALFFSDAVFKSYNNSIEEMKNLSKMARDHKRLVLGSTGKSFGETREKENIDFQHFIRSRSFNLKISAEPTNDPPRSRQSSGPKMGFMLSEHRKSLEKARGDEPPPQTKHLTSFHIQKREKLTLNSSENTPPHGPKCKQVLKRKAPQPLFQGNDDNPFEGVSAQIITHLLDVGIISVPGQGTYTMRKEHLSELLGNILLWLLRGEGEKGRSKCSSITLNKILSRLIFKMQHQVQQSRRKRLVMDSRTLSVNLVDQTDALAKVYLNKIGILTQEGHKLQQQVEKLTRYEQNIKQQCKYTQAMIQIKKRQLQQLQQCSQREQEHLQRLKEEVNKLEVDYKQLSQAENRVKNFILQQNNNKIVKEVLLQYKQIQADIYEYAAYLQSNQLASDLFYEPHPFRAIQGQIEDEIKKVNTAILQGKGTTQQKSVIMRDFVLDSMGKFKRKDEQMSKVMEFRTKCIHNFIEHMKRWLNNWEFKQEFLVNLRKEFAYDSTKLMEILERMKQGPADEVILGRMKELSNKIIQNYEFGNSFY